MPTLISPCLESTEHQQLMRSKKTNQKKKATYLNPAALFQGNLNTRLVQLQYHTVQKTNIFTASLLENSQDLEARDRRRPHQRVPTPVQHRADSASKIDYSGASHSAHGVQQATAGGGGMKEEKQNKGYKIKGKLY